MHRAPPTIYPDAQTTAEGLHDAGALKPVTSLRAFKQFCQRLSRPAAPNDRLRRTMQTKLPWNPD